MTTAEALDLIKQALAAVNCDWQARVQLVEAVKVVEDALANKSTQS